MNGQVWFGRGLAHAAGLGAAALLPASATLNVVAAVSPGNASDSLAEHLLPLVYHVWADRVGSRNTAVVLLLAAYQAAVCLLLLGARRHRSVVAGVAAVHLALPLLDPGWWPWSVPVLALVAVVWRHPPASARDGTG